MTRIDEIEQLTKEELIDKLIDMEYELIVDEAYVECTLESDADTEYKTTVINDYADKVNCKRLMMLRLIRDFGMTFEELTNLV